MADFDRTKVLQASGVGNLAVLRQRALNPKAMAVMASPPTVATSNTQTITAGQAWYFNSAGVVNGVNGGFASLFRGGYWRRLGASFPDNEFITADTVTRNTPTQFWNPCPQISFEHTGTRFEVYWKGAVSKMLIKVNGEFTSLTAQDGPSGLMYTLVTFGSSATRRIDLLGDAFCIGTIFTDATGTITPAIRRGPRTVVMADSFGGGTGAPPPYSWITYLAEFLGWDDVVPSAVGGCGLLAATSPSVKYRDRCVRDVAALSPEVVWISLSINDNPFTAADVLAEAQLLVSTIQANMTTRPLFVFSSPTIHGGAGKIFTSSRQQNDAVKAWCAAAGHIFVDDINLPIDGSAPTLGQTTLTAAATAGATSLSIPAYAATPGCAYRFADGTRVFVRSWGGGGTTVNIDSLLTSQANGATMTICENSYLTGTGRIGTTTGWGNADLAVSSDGTHPSDYGHRLKGYTDANLFLRALQT